MKSRLIEGSEKDSCDIKEKIKNAAEDSPTTIVEINGQPIKCLLDTGAEVSTISEMFYKQFLHQQDITDTRKFLRLSAANKITIPYLGYIEVDLKIQDQLFSDVGMLVETVTTDPNAVQVILGCNVLKHIRTACQCDNVIMKDPIWNNVMSVLALAENEVDVKIGLVKVAGRETIRIPANSMKTIVGSTRQNKKKTPIRSSRPTYFY